MRVVTDSLGRKVNKPKRNHPWRTAWSDKTKKQPQEARERLGWSDRMGLRF